MLLLALLLAAATQTPPDPHRQFDFWIGEWTVQNRHLVADGSWFEADVTRARITPVCGGKAILEEWAGPFHGAFMNGFSLRAWEPAREDWNLLLFWTTDGDGGFGTLRGGFRHGRGEFFSGEAPNLTRYSFSDALPRTVRWDSAKTTDGGSSWRTDWIMEFTRTRAAAEVTQDELFAVAWTEGAVSPHEEARALDWTLGRWTGVRRSSDGSEREARLRAKLLAKDCLVLHLLETREPGASDWDERLEVRGWASAAGRWESHGLSEADTVLRAATGARVGDVTTFERPATHGGVRREVLRPLADGRLEVSVTERRARGTEFEPRATTILARVAAGSAR